MLAFYFSLAQLLSSLRGEPPLVLLDDLTAELDSQRQSKVLDFLGRLGGQALVSAVSLAEEVGSRVPHQMFHVKQGRISK